MKLRTERSIVFGDAIDPVVHDAMAAHALMHAMAALDGARWSRLRNPVAEILERADAILAGWTGAGK